MKAIKILLKNQQMTLPVNYQSYLQGVIYKWLEYDEEYATFIHGTGAMIDNYHYKMFTFSSLDGKSTYRNHTLTFNGNLVFEVRAADDYFIDLIEKSIMENPYIRIGKQIIQIYSYEIHASNILTNTINISMRTPIIVRTTEQSGYVKYFRPDEINFYQAIVDNAIKKYEFVEHDEQPALSITPIKVTEHNKVVAHYKDMVLTGWKGIYQLQGTPDLMTFLYYTGIGERNSQGFGMFDIQ